MEQCANSKANHGADGTHCLVLVIIVLSTIVDDLTSTEPNNSTIPLANIILSYPTWI